MCRSGARSRGGALSRTALGICLALHRSHWKALTISRTWGWAWWCLRILSMSSVGACPRLTCIFLIARSTRLRCSPLISEPWIVAWLTAMHASSNTSDMAMPPKVVLINLGGYTCDCTDMSLQADGTCWDINLLMPSCSSQLLQTLSVASIWEDSKM